MTFLFLIKKKKLLVLLVGGTNANKNFQKNEMKCNI